MQESGTQNFQTSPALCLVKTSQLEFVWPKIRPLIENICKRSSGRLTPQDILGFIIKQEMLLWAAVKPNEIEAIMLTEIKVYPQKKMCVISACAGKNRKEWEKYMDKVFEYAKAEGCAGIESIARKGWTKVLKTRGFKHTHDFIELMFD